MRNCPPDLVIWLVKALMGRHGRHLTGEGIGPDLKIAFSEAGRVVVGRAGGCRPTDGFEDAPGWL